MFKGRANRPLPTLPKSPEGPTPIGHSPYLEDGKTTLGTSTAGRPRLAIDDLPWTGIYRCQRFYSTRAAAASATHPAVEHLLWYQGIKQDAD